MCVAGQEGLHVRCSYQLSKLACVWNGEKNMCWIIASFIKLTGSLRMRCFSNTMVKLFFVNQKGLKQNAKTYKKHLEKEFLPNVDRMNNTSWIFIQDPIDRTLYNQF